MTRRPIVAGNWKMYNTQAEGAALAQGVLAALGRLRRVDVVLCPPFTALAAVAKALKRRSVALGAQDCYWELQGAFTGEVSPAMLTEIGAAYCILGHSERRRHFGETNETVARKTQAVFAQGLTPIVCVGETLEERDAGRTLAVVETQVQIGLQPVTAEQAPSLVLAYEPVWAIGTGRNATPAQAQEVHAFLRQLLAKRFTPAIARQIRLQYGGSVKPENSAELIAQPDVDGFLVGGASLDAASFTAIVRAAAGVPAAANV
ncbi:MAG: triose-phosphate isomerase [Omnitrophica bacterium RIFCSPHIGHO2_02_FULL_63_14]|nr:MAG: triose-phosphate isomerase [Omnitrophica bacterium RIFCSPHIGHO2_02_FULL_63_14]